MVDGGGPTVDIPADVVGVVLLKVGSGRRVSGDDGVAEARGEALDLRRLLRGVLILAGKKDRMPIPSTLIPRASEFIQRTWVSIKSLSTGFSRKEN